MNIEHRATTQYLSGFPHALRQEGLNITPYHTSTFLTASQVISLQNINELYWAGRATLIDHVDNVATFDAVFESYFRFQGNKVLALGDGEKRESDDEDSISVESISRLVEQESIELVEGDAASKKASQAEALKSRQLLEPDEDENAYLQKIMSMANNLCPRKKTRRYRTHKKGKIPDIRGSIAQLPRADGEIIRMLRRKKHNSRKSILLLIDISGSMAAQLRANIFFAYAMMQGHGDLECFCLGTRLTRISELLKYREIGVALENISHTVLDWDGGTRLGNGLYTFLAQSNNLTLVRDAEVFILSDGLERGDPGKLIYTCRRLSQHSQHIHWLSPLAGGTDYKPETRAMKAIVPMFGQPYPSANLHELYLSLGRIWRLRSG